MTIKRVTLIDIRKIYVSVSDTTTNERLEDLFRQGIPEYRVVREVEKIHEVKVEEI